jgi:hypothetical protein
VFASSLSQPGRAGRPDASSISALGIPEAFGHAVEALQGTKGARHILTPDESDQAAAIGARHEKGLDAHIGNGRRGSGGEPARKCLGAVPCGRKTLRTGLLPQPIGGLAGLSQGARRLVRSRAPSESEDEAKLQRLRPAIMLRAQRDGIETEEDVDPCNGASRPCR